MDASAPQLGPFAAWVQARRKAAGLTQALLAARLGVAQGTVATWEQGANRCDDFRVDALASALGAEPAEAWEVWHAARKDEPPSQTPTPPSTHELVVELLETVGRLTEEMAQLRAEMRRDEPPPPA